MFARVVRPYGTKSSLNGMSCITEGASGYPWSNGIIRLRTGSSETLLMNGYNTYAVGKWHLTPAEQTSAAGPYDAGRWGADSNAITAFSAETLHQYYPDWLHDNHQVEPPKTPEEGYHRRKTRVDK